MQVTRGNVIGNPLLDRSGRVIAGSDGADHGVAE